MSDDFEINEVDEEEKKRSRFLIYVLIGFVIVLLIVASILVFYYVREQNVENELFVARMEMFKCISLCPVSEIGETRDLEISCRANCVFVYLEETEGLNSNDPDLHFDLSREFFYCIWSLRKDSQFDYQACYDDFFEKHSDEIDLSDYELPEYPVYNLSVDGYSCNEDALNVTVTYLEGDDFPAEVRFSLEGTDLSMQSAEYDIGLGDTRTYEIMYDDLNIDFNDTSGNFITVLTIDGKGIVWQEKNSCLVV